MRYSTLVLLALFPLPALAVGSDDTAPPSKTQTSETCETGTIWDTTAQLCKDPQAASLDDDARFGAVRELAYAGRYAEALDVLHAMQEGKTDRVLTYLGFVTRKSGDMAGGIAYYAQALNLNPDNLQTRSYLGQALVELGDIAAASTQLQEIRNRGGAGSWAETALALAVGSGQTLNY